VERSTFDDRPLSLTLSPADRGEGIGWGNAKRAELPQTSIPE
jgi:hypothetical protein